MNKKVYLTAFFLKLVECQPQLNLQIQPIVVEEVRFMGNLRNLRNPFLKVPGLVLEKWFCKLDFFFWSTTFLEPEKRWFIV